MDQPNHIAAEDDLDEEWPEAPSELMVSILRLRQQLLGSGLPLVALRSQLLSMITGEGGG